jgi:Ca2+-binding RTX toxin-like protein
MSTIHITIGAAHYGYTGSDMVIVDPGATVGDSDPLSPPFVTSTAVSCIGIYAGAQLFNSGTIQVFGPGVEAVSMDAAGSLVYNTKSGQIIGADGVEINNLSETIDNDGSIQAARYGVFLDYSSDAAVVNNSGTITGNIAAVSAQSGSDATDGGKINNFGDIRGMSAASDGVDVNTWTDLTTTITNAVNATIEGGNHGIEIEYGAISLHNHGTIDDGIYDHGGGDNVIVNTGVISGGIIFGNGKNSYQGAGGTVDQITCGAGNDEIVLGKGSTAVYFADGHDVLTAGSGKDTFVFTSHLHVDRISGFNPHLDRIVLSKAAFAGIVGQQGVLASGDFVIGSHALTKAEHIIYNAHNGFLYYDTDGSGPAHKIHFATLDPHLHITAQDFLVSA